MSTNLLGLRTKAPSSPTDSRNAVVAEDTQRGYPRGCAINRGATSCIHVALGVGSAAVIGGRGAWTLLVVLLVLACAGLFAGSASARTTWLCRPGLADNPCAVSLQTTVFSPAGRQIGALTPKAVKRPKIDCFYVYPTVSDQK